MGRAILIASASIAGLAAAASDQFAGLHTRSGQCAAAIMTSWSAVNIVSP